MSSTIFVRSIIAPDTEEVFDIAKDGYPDVELDTQFYTLASFRKAKLDCRVATYRPDDKPLIVGYIVTRQSQTHIEVLQIVAAQKRIGVGTELLEDVIQSAQIDGLKVIEATVCETNDAAIAFFKSHGFSAKRVIHRAYGDNDGYYFRRNL